MSQWRHWADKHFRGWSDPDFNQSWNREVFFALGEIPSRSEWQEAIHRAGYKLNLDEGFDPKQSQKLFVCQLDGSTVEFEYHIGPIPENRWNPSERFNGRAAFVSYGILTDEIADRAYRAAIIAAAVLCKVVDGVLVDNEAQQTSEASEVMGYLAGELGEP